MNYSEIITILRAAEQTLIGIKSIEVNRRGVRGYVDTMLIAPWLVMAGAKMIIWRVVWVLIAGATFTLVLMALGGGQLRQLLAPSFIFGLGVVYFSAPSRSLIANVKMESVAAVRGIILSASKNATDLQNLHDGIAIVRMYSMEKLSRFSVLIGIGWGVLFWYASTHALALGLSAETMRHGLSFGLLASLFFGFVLIVGACYATAVRALFQLLEIAFLEAKSRFASCA